MRNRTTTRSRLLTKFRSPPQTFAFFVLSPFINPLSSPPLQLPSLPIRRIQVSIRLIIVHEARPLLIPLQRLPRKTYRNQPQQRHLAQRSPIAEIRSGLAPRANRFRPVPCVSFDSRQLL